jgi:hypothetical protein
VHFQRPFAFRVISRKVQVFDARVARSASSPGCRRQTGDRRKGWQACGRKDLAGQVGRRFVAVSSTRDR